MSKDATVSVQRIIRSLVNSDALNQLTELEAKYFIGLCANAGNGGHKPASETWERRLVRRTDEDPLRSLRDKGLLRFQEAPPGSDYRYVFELLCLPQTVSRSQQLREMPYADYLQTEEWQKRRKMALEVAGRRCQVCNMSANLDVHHRTYKRRGEELPGDLTVLCHTCHTKFHDKEEGATNG